ncbi:MAG: DUF1549 domain-containing protein [Pirellulales bacterium]
MDERWSLSAADPTAAAHVTLRSQRQEPALRINVAASVRCAMIFICVAIVWVAVSNPAPNDLRAQEPAQPASAQPPVAAPAPLHARIDELLRTDADLLTAPQAEPGTWLRKVSLDLRNAAPTGEEIKAFTADAAPDKWQKTVTQYLQDPLHQERMVDWWDKTLMQRRPFPQVDRNQWIAWLRTQVEERQAIDVVVRNMLTAPWWDNSRRPALRFFLDRGGDPHLITRDLGRVLLGRDFQCAQCHDHPLVDDYRQADYHGLLAFVSSSTMVEGTYKNEKGEDAKSQLYIEKPGADAPFESVFDKGVLIRLGARLPESSEVPEAYDLPDERLVADVPAGSMAGIPKPPKVSRRAMLAEQFTGRDRRTLAKNFANRLWAVAFGRGLVHPLDMHHADNPASHPELLELLTDSLIEMQFDADRFLEQLMLTQAYRRGGEPTNKPWPINPAASPDAFSAEFNALAQQMQTKLVDLNARQKAAEDAAKAADAAMVTARDAWRAAQVARNAVRAELDKAEAAFNDVKKKSTDAEAARAAAVQKQQAALTRIALLDEAAAKLDQALKSVPAEDAEIKQAFSIAKAKADAGRTESAALDKAVQDTTAAAQAAVAALDAPRATIREIVGRLEASNAAITPLDAAFVAARSDWRRKEIELMHQEEAVEQTERIVQLIQSLDAARKRLAERTLLDGQVATAQEQLAAAEQQLIQSNEIAKTAAAALNDSQTVVNNSKAAREAHEGELNQLRTARKQLEGSLALVTAQDPIKAAMVTLDETLAGKATRTAELDTQVGAAVQNMTAAAEKSKVAQAEAAARLATRDAMQMQMVATKTNAEQARVKLEEAVQAVGVQWTSVMADRERLLATARLRPLSPEQLGLSVLRVPGIVDNYIQNETAELNKTQPLAADADAATQAKRQLTTVRQALDKLRGIIDSFASLYSSGVGQTADEFFASPDQALYMANGGSVFAWAGPSGQNVTQRVIAAKDDNAAAVIDMYTTMLGRQPTAAESQFVIEQLQQAGDKRPAIAQELVWAIFTGAEFRFYR